MSRFGGPRLGILGLAVCGLTGLAGCELADVGVGDQPQGPAAEVPPEQRVAARTLAVGRCAGSGLVPDVTGVYVFAFETVSTIAGGNLTGAQTEVVTRYGVAQLCQTDDRVDAALLVCTFDQGSVLDDTGTCAAQLPSIELLATLPGIRLTGAVDLANQSVRITGFEESWGLPAGTNPPGDGNLAGLIDQDADDDPGVSLFGTGAVPTISWAARRTVADFALQVASPTALGGVTTSSTAQSIAGGPAERVIAGRQRAGANGSAIFIRADGLDGSGIVDQNQNGAVTCAEMAPWIGQVLPLPREYACTP